MRPAVEPEQVGEDERHDAEQRVGDDVEGDEQAVVASHHRAPAGAASVSSTTPAQSRLRTARGRSARRARGCAPGRTASPRARRDRVGERLGRRVVDEHAGLAVDRRSRARRRGRAPRPAGRRPALRPARCRSPLRRAGARACARRYSVAERLVVDAAEELDRRRRPARSQPRPLGPVADDRQRHAEPAGRRRSPGRCACTARGPTPRGNGARATSPSGREERPCRPADTRPSPRDYSIGAILPAT